MKNIAVYYRVSTDKQDLDSQIYAVEKWLEALDPSKKPKNIRVFQDKGISGSTMNRPEFNEMMKLVYTKSIDTILVYRLDRFSRSANAALRTILEMDAYEVGFVSVTQPILNLNNDNPFRRTMLAAFAEIAEIERETTVARVHAGLDAARKRGVKLGAPVKISSDLKEKARELKNAGQSYRQISQSIGVSLGTIHKMLKDKQSNEEI